MINKADKLIKEFCELCKTTGYNNFEQRIFSFFKENGFSEDLIDITDIEFSIIDEIFAANENLSTQLDFIEQHIDKKDKKIFFEYYIEKEQPEVIAHFLQKLTSPDLLHKFNKVFEKKLHKTGLRLDFESTILNKLYDNMLFKIADPNSNNLENFILTCYKKNFTKIKKNPDDNILIDMLYEIQFAAPHIIKNINHETLKTNQNVYDYLKNHTDLLEIESNTSPSANNILSL